MRWLLIGLVLGYGVVRWTRVILREQRLTRLEHLRRLGV